MMGDPFSYTILFSIQFFSIQFFSLFHYNLLSLEDINALWKTFG